MARGNGNRGKNGRGKRLGTADVGDQAAKGQTALEVETPARLKRDAPRLSVPHDNELTVKALAHHGRNLLKLADRNTEEGYKSAAAAQLGDARSIAERIIPQFADQLTEPLASPAESRAALANVFREVVRRSRELKRDDEDLVVALAFHADKLLGGVYARAFNDGVATREMDPHVAVVYAVAEHDSTRDTDKKED